MWELCLSFTFPRMQFCLSLQSSKGASRCIRRLKSQVMSFREMATRLKMFLHFSSAAFTPSHYICLLSAAVRPNTPTMCLFLSTLSPPHCLLLLAELLSADTQFIFLFLFKQKKKKTFSITKLALELDNQMILTHIPWLFYRHQSSCPLQVFIF